MENRERTVRNQKNIVVSFDIKNEGTWVEFWDKTGHNQTAMILTHQLINSSTIS